MKKRFADGRDRRERDPGSVRHRRSHDELAERVGVFSVVMGVALLPTGIGFLVLTLGGALGSAARPRRAGTRRLDGR